MDLEILFGVWRRKYGCGGQSSLQLLKAFLALGSPLEFLIFLEEFRKRLCNFRKVFNEATAIAGWAKKTSNLLNRFRWSPVKDGLNSLGIDNNAFCRYHVA